MEAKSPHRDMAYKLKGNFAPLSYTLASRNSKSKPLTHYDEKKGNRALRYAVNHASVFEDEQKGQAILEPIVFENGFLTVPKENQTLQKFLHIHPQSGKVFEEVNKKRDAEDDLDKFDLQDDAILKARELSIDELETVARVTLGKNIDKYTVPELKRDVRQYARNKPEAFLKLLQDPTIQYRAKVKMFFEQRLLSSRNKDKEVFFNLPNNKGRMLQVPFGEEAYEATAAFLKSDDGIATLTLLEEHLEAL